jgi:hypothetical protein
MKFSGIICRHIFKVAAQLNLEELPQHLFLIRWRKDPSENILVKMYKSFYNSAEALGTNRENENFNDIREDIEDYEYLLNRIWYKVQQIVKAKPETSKDVYVLLDKFVKDLFASEENSQTQNNEKNNRKIKNPVTVKPKGKFLLNICILFIIYLLIHFFLNNN